VAPGHARQQTDNRHHHRKSFATTARRRCQHQSAWRRTAVNVTSSVEATAGSSPFASRLAAVERQHPHGAPPDEPSGCGARPQEAASPSADPSAGPPVWRAGPGPRAHGGVRVRVQHKKADGESACPMRRLASRAYCSQNPRRTACVSTPATVNRSASRAARERCTPGGKGRNQKSVQDAPCYVRHRHCRRARWPRATEFWVAVWCIAQTCRRSLRVNGLYTEKRCEHN
jgi:hypothetical protein